MKAKTFNKKLILKKETVSNLRDTEMKNVAGGTGETGYYCLTMTICSCGPVCLATFHGCTPTD
ncbi:MAG TPA: class I lanthipeptide [Candidatus Deferrimicrobium sp.]|nr:class I lanthipeptide [Candidatus Deferrimicrobium sp.]